MYALSVPAFKFSVDVAGWIFCYRRRQRWRAMMTMKTPRLSPKPSTFVLSFDNYSTAITTIWNIWYHKLYGDFVDIKNKMKKKSICTEMGTWTSQTSKEGSWVENIYWNIYCINRYTHIFKYILIYIIVYKNIFKYIYTYVFHSRSWQAGKYCPVNEELLVSSDVRRILIFQQLKHPAPHSQHRLPLL